MTDDGDKEPGYCAELEDLGGGAPLPFDDDTGMLRAACAALYTLSGQETGERSARLLLLAGWVLGYAHSDRRPKAYNERRPKE